MTGFGNKAILLDGRSHLLGPLASVVDKTFLQGNGVTVVRSELINISENFFRAKLKYLSFLRKRCNVNPARGPYHFRALNKILWRTVRGMLPHKTEQGKAALNRLKAFEGCPPPYDMIYLLTAIRLSSGGSAHLHTIHITIQNKQYIEKHNNFGRVRAVPCLG